MMNWLVGNIERQLQGRGGRMEIINSHQPFTPSLSIYAAAIYDLQIQKQTLEKKS